MTRRGRVRGSRIRPRRHTIRGAILALDEDQVLFCSCAAGCDDCDDE